MSLTCLPRFSGGFLRTFDQEINNRKLRGPGALGSLCNECPLWPQKWFLSVSWSAVPVCVCMHASSCRGLLYRQEGAAPKPRAVTGQPVLLLAGLCRDLSLVEQLVEGLGSVRTQLSLSVEGSWQAYLPFLQTFFPPCTSTHPKPVPQTLRCFQISESRAVDLGNLADSGLDPPPAQGECQILVRNYSSSDLLPSYLNGGVVIFTSGSYHPLPEKWCAQC